MGKADVELSCYADCDDGTLAIPKNDFESQFSWKCYEASRSYLPVLLLAWLGGLVVAFHYVYYSSQPGWCILIIIGFIVGVILSPIIYGERRKKSVNRLISRNVSLLAEIVEEIFRTEQNNLPLAWGKVASKLNEQLYVAGKWRTRYCFYDCVLCEVYFRRYVLKPNFLKSPKEQNNLLATAANTYQRTIRHQFNLAKKERIILPDQTLPRDFESWDRNRPVREVSESSESTTSKRIQILAIIATIAPGEDIDRWDEVARRVNALTDQNPTRGVYSNLWTFFDGKHGLRFYLRYFDALTKKIARDDIPTYELVPLISEIKKEKLV